MRQDIVGAPSEEENDGYVHGDRNGEELAFGRGGEAVDVKDVASCGIENLEEGREGCRCWCVEWWYGFCSRG